MNGHNGTPVASDPPLHISRVELIQPFGEGAPGELAVDSCGSSLALWALVKSNGNRVPFCNEGNRVPSWMQTK